MNRLDSWLQGTPRRRIAFWLAFVLPLAIGAFVFASLNPDAYRAKAALVAGPILIVAAIVQSRRAYRELRR